MRESPRNDFCGETTSAVSSPSSIFCHPIAAGCRATGGAGKKPVKTWTRRPPVSVRKKVVFFIGSAFFFRIKHVTWGHPDWYSLRMLYLTEAAGGVPIHHP
jgi:hypothetical protein